MSLTRAVVRSDLVITTLTSPVRYSRNALNIVFLGRINRLARLLLCRNGTESVDKIGLLFLFCQHIVPCQRCRHLASCESHSAPSLTTNLRCKIP